VADGILADGILGDTGQSSRRNGTGPTLETRSGLAPAAQDSADHAQQSAADQR
jgi:hypothetical protein